MAVAELGIVQHICAAQQYWVPLLLWGGGQTCIALRKCATDFHGEGTSETRCARCECLQGQVCSLQKGHNCATVMAVPCATWWPAPGCPGKWICTDCWTKLGITCPHKPVCKPCFMRLKRGGDKDAPAADGAGGAPAAKNGRHGGGGVGVPAALPVGPDHATGSALQRLLRVRELHRRFPAHLPTHAAQAFAGGMM